MEPSAGLLESSSVGERGSIHPGKYVIFAPWPVKSGTGVNNAIFGLAGAAMRDDYDAEIVVTGWQQPPPEQKWLKLHSAAPPLRNVIGFLLHLLPNSLKLRRLTRQAAAVNAHYFSSAILPLAFLKKLGLLPNLILSVHGSDVKEAMRGTWLERKLYAWICQTADVVIPCSHDLGVSVSKLSPKANVKAVWNGISSPRSPAGPRRLAAPYLISVGAFVKKKGHDTLLKAFAAIKDQFPSLQLVLLGGDGPERINIKNQIVQMGLSERVKMLLDLPHEDVWDWVRHAECFALASREEPFGLAIVEAGLVGTPVVTTCVGGIPEYLTHQVDGLTCKPDNPRELAAAITETLTDRTAARARAAAFQAKARGFTWEEAWSKYREYAGLPAKAHGSNSK